QDFLLDACTRSRLREQQARLLELLLAGDRRHVFGVRLAGGELSGPSLVVLRIDRVETDADRTCFGHGVLLSRLRGRSRVRKAQASQPRASAPPSPRPPPPSAPVLRLSIAEQQECRPTPRRRSAPESCQAARDRARTERRRRRTGHLLLVSLRR